MGNMYTHTRSQERKNELQNQCVCVFKVFKVVRKIKPIKRKRTEAYDTKISRFVCQ